MQKISEEFQIPHTTFCKREMLAAFGRYAHDGSLAIEAVGAVDRELEFRATVIMVNDPPPDGCVWLKGWSENDGVPEALEAAGIVVLTGDTTPAGHTFAQLGRLTDRTIAEIERLGV